MYYVTMTDKFLSGWGRAEGRIAKFIFECVDRRQAEIVKRNAERRSDQKNINILVNKPYYTPKKYLAQFITQNDGYTRWFTEGGF